MTSRLDELERSLSAILRLLGERATLDDIAHRSGYDLPPVSWALLEHLDTRGALRVSEVAACHGVDISSVTPRLKRLEGAGLVSRARAPSDARAFLINITSEGRRALENVHAARREMLERAIGDADPGPLRMTTDVLTRLADSLSEQSPAEHSAPSAARNEPNAPSPLP